MKKIYVVFVILFLCCISYPILRFHGNITVSQEENRNLASKPLLIKDGNLNPNYFAEANLFLQDHFGGRGILIRLSNKVNNYIDDKIFHKIQCNDRAIEGKDGWYFYISQGDGANLVDYLKKNLMSEDQLLNFKQNVTDVTKWCDENGIKYLFLICPNKHCIYPEKYPFSRPEGITRADQISEVFNSLGVPFVYSRDYILSKKKEFSCPLYYETDTHWNSLGAYLCFEQIFPAIQNQFKDIYLPRIDYEMNIGYGDGGDILPMLGIQKSKTTNITMSPKNGKDADYFEYIKNEGVNGVKTVNKNKDLPKAIVFRDSFCSSLVQYISPLFSEVEYNWRQFRDADKDYVLKSKPDLIIFESVERYSSSIVSK